MYTVYTVSLSIMIETKISLHQTLLLSMDMQLSELLPMLDVFETTKVHTRMLPGRNQ